jgi:hypothetical protein
MMILAVKYIILLSPEPLNHERMMFQKSADMPCALSEPSACGTVRLRPQNPKLIVQGLDNQS